MDPMTIIAGVQLAIKAAAEARELVAQWQGHMSETDEAKLKEELDKLREENDALYATTITRLTLLGGDG